MRKNFCLNKNRISIFLFTIFLSAFSLNQTVLAKESPEEKYLTDMDVTVNLLRNFEAEVTQTISITNRSEELLTSSISFILPFETVTNLKVVVDGEKSTGIVKEKEIIIDFSKQPLENGETVKISTSYRVPNFIENYGKLYRITWPQFLNRQKPLNHNVVINYPEEWGDIIYYSKKPIDKTNLDSYQIYSFATKTQLDIVIGEYTFKEAKLGITPERVKANPKSLTFNIFKGTYLNAGESVLQKITSPSISNEFSKLYILDLNKYEQNRIIKLINIDDDFISIPSLADSKYDLGTDLISESKDLSPRDVFLLVNDNLSPSYNIRQWDRESVSQILNKEHQTDLDYANVSAGLLKQNGYPSMIVLGMVEYPFSREFYWHFWVVYQDEEGEYHDFDPFLQDAFGVDYIDNVNPFRFMWQPIDVNSDLSDILPDIFNFQIQKVNFRYFESISSQTGYLISQTKRPLIAEEDTSDVLGLSDSVNNFNTTLMVSITQIFVFFGLLATFVITMLTTYGYYKGVKLKKYSS